MLLAFLDEQLLVAREHQTVDLQEPLLDGLLDSRDTLRFVVFIKEQFQVPVDDGELAPENFETVAHRGVHLPQTRRHVRPLSSASSPPANGRSAQRWLSLSSGDANRRVTAIPPVDVFVPERDRVAAHLMAGHPQHVSRPCRLTVCVDFMRAVASTPVQESTIKEAS
jgi:acyl carrier protein